MSDGEHRLNTCLLRASLAFERGQYEASVRSYRDALGSLEALFSQLPDVKRVVQRAYYRVFRAELMASISLAYWRLFAGERGQGQAGVAWPADFGGPTGSASATSAPSAPPDLLRASQALEAAIRLCPDPLYFERSAIFNLELGRVSDAFADLGRAARQPFISREAVIPALGRAYLVSPSVVLALRAMLAAHSAELLEAMTLVSQAFSVLGQGREAIDFDSKGGILLRAGGDGSEATPKAGARSQPGLSAESAPDAQICLLALCEISRLISDQAVKLPVRLGANLEARLSSLFHREPAGVSVNALLNPQALAQFAFSVYADLGGDQSLPGRGLDRLPTLAALFRTVFRDCLSGEVTVGRLAGYTAPSIVCPDVWAALAKTSAAYSHIANESANVRVLLDQDVRAWLLRIYGIHTSAVFPQAGEGAERLDGGSRGSKAGGVGVVGSGRSGEGSPHRQSPGSERASALTLQDLGRTEALDAMLRSLGRPGTTSTGEKGHMDGAPAPRPLAISRSQTPERRCLPIGGTRVVGMGKKYVPVLSGREIHCLRASGGALRASGGSPGQARQAKQENQEKQQRPKISSNPRNQRFLSAPGVSGEPRASEVPEIALGASVGSQDVPRALTLSLGGILESQPLDYYSPRRTTCDVCSTAKPTYAARRISDAEEIRAIQSLTGAGPPELGGGSLDLSPRVSAEQSSCSPSSRSSSSSSSSCTPSSSSPLPAPRLSLGSLVQAKVERTMASSGRARQILSETMTKARAGAQDLGLGSRVSGGAQDRGMMASDANFDLSGAELARLRRESPSLRLYAEERAADLSDSAPAGARGIGRRGRPTAEEGHLAVRPSRSGESLPPAGGEAGELGDGRLCDAVEASLAELGASAGDRGVLGPGRRLPDGFQDEPGAERAGSRNDSVFWRKGPEICLSRAERHFDTLSNTVITQLTVAALSRPGSRAGDFASINSLRMRSDSAPLSSQPGLESPLAAGHRPEGSSRGSTQRAVRGLAGRALGVNPLRSTSQAGRESGSGTQVRLSASAVPHASGLPDGVIDAAPRWGLAKSHSASAKVIQSGRRKGLMHQGVGQGSAASSARASYTRRAGSLGAEGRGEPLSEGCSQEAGLDHSRGGQTCQFRQDQRGLARDSASAAPVGRAPREPRRLDRAFVVPAPTSPHMLRTGVSAHLFVVG